MSNAVPSEIAAVQDGWRRRGRYVTLSDGHRLFALQEGAGPDLVLVHGFPSTSHDFAAALPRLAAAFRVTLFDQLGFGFSDRPRDASYSLLEQGRRAGELVRALGVERAQVVGHDMGLTVAIEMLCRHEAGTLGFAMTGLGLCNGSHLVELANVTPLQKDLLTDEGAATFAATYDPERFAALFRLVWGEPARAPDLDVRAIAYWLRESLPIIGKIARYNVERAELADRWRPILGRTDVPIHVVWGARDPIAVLEIGRRLATMADAPLTVLDGVGHYPQMEDPARWASAVLRACGRGD
ncbi:MAG TPA: alpha/beta hydrolase [Candidatus Binatia bacterium]|nr:alpha/beta hydrolase [Candidatus Binatia bacterium]